MVEPEALAALEAQISDEIIRVHEDSYGVGATKTVTHVVDDAVIVIIDVVLTTAEKTLIGGGFSEAVRTQRESFQEVIGPTFTAVVERATGRRVESFMSHMQVDPGAPYSVELFRLGPRKER